MATFSAYRPLAIFIAAMAGMNCVLGFVLSRTLVNEGPLNLQQFIAFVQSALAVAQYAVATVWGGIIFRRWIVGVTVSVFIAVFWLCCFLCWQFPIFWQNASVPNRFTESMNAVCLTPVIVLAGCLPLLLIRVGMCQARPRGNSIVELFAITSFFASIVVVTRLGSMNAVGREFVFFCIMAALGSAVSVTPASLLYFMSKDRAQGTQRFLFYAAAFSGLLCSLPMIAGVISLLPLVWFLLVCTTLFLGFHCMHLSGLRIPSELSSPDERSIPEMHSDQTQFIWVIISSIAAAFCINLFVAMMNVK